MVSVVSHWHGLSCLELVVDRPLRPELFRQLGAAARRLRESGIADGAASSYASIAAYWNRPPSDKNIAKKVADVVRQSLELEPEQLAGTSRSHIVDVHYQGEDLDELAEHCGLTPRDIVQRHVSPQYVVAAVGFLPNFAYLWGLDPAIAAPRKSTPRVRVPAGSLGVAGEQTGIYPSESPGGWQLIGQVDPDVCKTICPQMQIGDTVRFQERQQ